MNVYNECLNYSLRPFSMHMNSQRYAKVCVLVARSFTLYLYLKYYRAEPGVDMDNNFKD